jgi:putative hydrolase of HD superfamily
MKDLIHLFYEIGMLDTTPRSGFAFLGSGKQSVSEHSFRMTLIAYSLAKELKENIDEKKLLLMCLFHDLPEARTGDLNYINKKYVVANELKVLEDLQNECRLGPEIATLLEEYRLSKSLEAQIAHDADQLELMLVLKRELELGNSFAKLWLENAAKRLVLAPSLKIAEEIMITESYQWWHKD